MMDTLLAFGAALLQAGGMLAVAPLLKTVIKKMKARLQNRQGPPLFQGYYDLLKLLRKESVRSETASWIYVAGPRVYFAAAVARAKRPRASVPTRSRMPPAASRGAAAISTGTSVVAATAEPK